jgi:hypothetical protein
MWASAVSAMKDILGLPTDAAKGAALIATIYATLTNYRMWRSLGWLLLGIVIAILGLVVWNRRTIGAAIQAA